MERNREMIDQSRFCILYCDESYAPGVRKSGTKTAFDYAVERKKKMINCF